jgi:hypothetical protein
LIFCFLSLFSIIRAESPVVTPAELEDVADLGGERRSDIGLGLRDQLVCHPTSGGNADEHCTRSDEPTRRRQKAVNPMISASYNSAIEILSILSKGYLSSLSARK